MLNRGGKKKPLSHFLTVHLSTPDRFYLGGEFTFILFMFLGGKALHSFADQQESESAVRRSSAACSHRESKSCRFSIHADLVFSFKIFISTKKKKSCPKICPGFSELISTEFSRRSVAFRSQLFSPSHRFG